MATVAQFQMRKTYQRHLPTLHALPKKESPKLGAPAKKVLEKHSKAPSKKSDKKEKESKRSILKISDVDKDDDENEDDIKKASTKSKSASDKKSNSKAFRGSSRKSMKIPLEEKKTTTSGTKTELSTRSKLVKSKIPNIMSFLGMRGTELFTDGGLIEINDKRGPNCIKMGGIINALQLDKRQGGYFIRTNGACDNFY